MNINYKVKIRDFDIARIEREFNKGKKTAMMKSGGMVRTIARRSIRKRAWRHAGGKGRKAKGSQYVAYWGGKTAISDPDGPPRSHTSGNTFGIRTIMFKYDSRTDTVVVGPIGGDRSKNSIPKVLEYGGQTVTTIPAYAHAKKASLGVASGRPYKLRKNIRARPFMRPALKTFESSYPKMFRDSLGKR